MEPTDLELIGKLVPQNAELKKLMEEHQKLELELERLQARRYLTPSEEIEKKRIQKLKLVGRDRIEAILSKHREVDV